MPKVLEHAVAEVATLPEADQEQLGRELLAHVERLRALRAALADGMRSLDAGRGRPLDIDEVIAKARARDGSS
jgi:hypothetical protein